MTPAARTVSTLTMALLALAAGAPACAQDLALKAELCDACHGVKGIPPDPTMPVIWGQHQAYLNRQMNEFKVGNRQNAPMLFLTQNMSQEEMTALAEYYSQK